MLNFSSGRGWEEALLWANLQKDFPFSHFQILTFKSFLHVEPWPFLLKIIDGFKFSREYYIFRRITVSFIKSLCHKQIMCFPMFRGKFFKKLMQKSIEFDYLNFRFPQKLLMLYSFKYNSLNQSHFPLKS